MTANAFLTAFFLGCACGLMLTLAGWLLFDVDQLDEIDADQFDER